MSRSFARGSSGTVTVQDVAERAGVSVASVSRVLNKSGNVSSRLKHRIEEAVADLGYVPHGAAQALASRRSKTIGAVVPTLENPTFAIGVEALQRYLTRSGYMLLLASSNYDPDQELLQVRTLVGRGVDGMMLVGNVHDSKLYDFLDEKGIPYVNTWVLDPSGKIPSVGFDNRQAATDLVNYLLDLGHRDFGVIAGLTVANDRAQARVDGVREALARKGLSLTREKLIERPYKILDGKVALRELLKSPKPPTAVICGNDLLAFGAMLECYERGISIPEEISIAGFDDLDFAAHLSPSLTTVRVPADEIGMKAAEFLLSRIKGDPILPITEIDVNFVVRKSTGPPPG
jgi:LacI family transcriptional regulator